MCLRFTSIHLNNGLNKKGRKTHGPICDKSINKSTSVQRDGVNVRDRKDVMTCYPKEKTVKSVNSLEFIFGLDPQVTDLPQSKDITSMYGKVGLRTRSTPRVSETIHLAILNSLPLIQVVK